MNKQRELQREQLVFIPSRLLDESKVENERIASVWKKNMEQAQAALCIRFDCKSGTFLPVGLLNRLVFESVKMFNGGSSRCNKLFGVAT